MAPPRRFDHDEARRLYATGQFTINALAARLGTHWTAVARVVDEEVRERELENYRQRARRPCVNGCGRTAWHSSQTQGRCRPCAYEAACRAEHGTESRYSRGCRCDACRRAASAARRERRNRVGAVA